MTRLPVLLVFVASVASANVWDNAITHGKPDPAQEKYEAELRNGDEHALQADVRSISYKEAKTQVQAAIAAYKAAAAAKPKEAEPYFRLASVVFAFYIDGCDRLGPLLNPSVLCSATFDRKRAEEVIGYWNEFETRAPDDPRLGVEAGGDTQILFDRAILHTKLAVPPNAKPHLEAAARDYEKILSRNNRPYDSSEQVLGNLAETYMMLNRMDESIDTYREVLRAAADTATWYGYAVALDRDEHPAQAFDIIRSLGEGQRRLFHADVERGKTFYVPEGEKYYYFALSDEAFNDIDSAIESWRAYVASGAHPEFQPRAKAHLDKLLGQKKRSGSPLKPPWDDIFKKRGANR